MKVKKILLTLWIIWLWFINFSHWQAVWETSYLREIQVWWQNTYNWITTEFKQNWNFQYSVFENIKVLNNYYQTSNPMLSRTFWHNWMLYWIANSTTMSNSSLWIPRYWWQWYLPLCLTQWTWDKDFCMSNFSFDYYNNPEYYNPDSLQSYSFNRPHVFCFVYYNKWEKLCWYLSRDNSFTWWNLFDSWVFSNTDDRLVTIPQSSPRGWGWWGWGNITWNTNWTPMCSTIQNQINLYGSNYTTSLCWSDWKININGEITNTWYVSIFTAYPTYQAYLSWYELYNNFCDKENPTYDYSECLEALRELPMWRAWVVLIWNAIKSQLPTQKIYQYCYYQLHFTQEQKNGSGVCEFTDEQIYAPWITWELKNKANWSVMDLIVDSIHNLQDATDQFITPDDWTIFDSILPEWVIWRKQAIFNLDLIDNTRSLINKILTIFRNRPIVDWILPPALTSLLLLIILFRMYKK